MYAPDENLQKTINQILALCQASNRKNLAKTRVDSLNTSSNELFFDAQSHADQSEQIFLSESQASESSDDESCVSSTSEESFSRSRNNSIKSKSKEYLGESESRADSRRRTHSSQTDHEVLIENSSDDRLKVYSRSKLESVRQNKSVNIFAILKPMIGKDFSKIAMPVILNEPLSMLQRMCEDLEYYELLELAKNCESSVDRMVYVSL